MTPASPAHRARFINGLRDLANFLSAHFGYPVPSRTEIIVFPDGADYAERCAQVDRLALILGATVKNSLGHYSAERAFGPVSYRIVAVSDTGEPGDE
ncbi:MAG: hypothetical protein ACRDN0_01300 [Trebonia sp.]